jgi:hypothetical protein
LIKSLLIKGNIRVTLDNYAKSQLNSENQLSLLDVKSQHLFPKLILFLNESYLMIKKLALDQLIDRILTNG